MDSKRLHFEKSKSYPLGNDDIMELIDLEPSNIFTSEKLESVNNIDELLDRLGRGVLCYGELKMKIQVIGFHY
jgi:hypothetical protein